MRTDRDRERKREREREAETERKGWVVSKRERRMREI
jgi:hypothetical protein